MLPESRVAIVCIAACVARPTGESDKNKAPEKPDRAKHSRMNGKLRAVTRSGDCVDTLVSDMGLPPHHHTHRPETVKMGHVCGKV